MYIKLAIGVIEKASYSIGQLRKDNPGTSFPKIPSNELVAEWGVFPIKPTQPPDVDHTKNVIEKLPVRINNEWVQTWEVVNATEEEINERVNSWAQNIRSERNQKLIDSDWTQIPDSAVDKDAWRVYRQELRDITKQSSFPYAVIWPRQP